MSDVPIKDHVQAIYDALTGKPVLLCIPTGRKGPLDKGWDQTTWEDTQDPEYQANLRRGNVGVMLGSASRYQDPSGAYCLCSIDIDTDEELQPFLALNPLLKDTLVTVGRRGGNIWLWVLAESYPPFAKLSFSGEDGKADAERPWGEWRSEGLRGTDGKIRRFQTVIWGTHPEGQQYRRVSEGTHPVRADFKEIVWPDSVFLPWRKSAFEELVETHGQPWVKSKNGALSLNTTFFAAKYAMDHRVLYEPEEQCFYDYCAQRGLWQSETEDRLRWKFALDFKSVANAAEEPGLELKRTNAFLGGLVGQLRGCVEQKAAFRREAGIVHVLNGMLDLRKNPPAIGSFGPEYFSRNQLAVALDELADCPRFKKELLETAMAPEEIALLQRWAGQLLLGVNLTQRIMVLEGTAGGGKSTLINILSRIVGQDNVAGLRTAQLDERFELFNYVGKTFLIGADVQGNFLMTDGAHVLKALVGKDVLTAEKKSGGSMLIIGDFNIGLTCNSRLRVRLDGDAAAWRRRLLIVTYERPAVAHPNPLFVEELLASEASGILNWMIAGAMMLLAEIREHGGMQLTAKQSDRVDSLLAESDSLREFLRKAVATADHSCSLTGQELAAAYMHYCEERGWNALPARKVDSMLPDLMLEVHRAAKRNDIVRDSKNQRGYLAVRLLPIGEPDERKEAHDATPFG
jgi:P4 family phage/plasmid primase-like protien